MSDEATLLDFERWMVQSGYRDSTIKRSIQDARQLFTWTDENRALPVRLKNTTKRLMKFFDRYDIEPQGRLADAIDAVLTPPPEASPLEKRRADQARRKRQQTSYSDDAWKALWSAIVADDDPAARVLEIMGATGLRVGDVLRLTRHRLVTGLPDRVITIEQKGGDERLVYIEGSEAPWIRLHQAFEGQPAKITNVALLVAPDGNGSPLSADAAYRKVERTLKRLGKSLGLPGPHRTHRLRRTVAVQALRITEDVTVVQQLLGHKNYQTTLGYVSEARPERQAELRRQLAERFRE